MPRVVVTKGAGRGLTRCLGVLARHDPASAQRAARSIEKHFALLETNPAIGRPAPERPNQRELVMSFGNAGYVALYRWDAAADAIYILASRHQREAGY